MQGISKQDILDHSGLSLPLNMDGKKLFSTCKAHGFTRYTVSKKLLGVTTTTGRTISLNEGYVIKIDEDFKVSIDKVTSVK